MTANFAWTYPLKQIWGIGWEPLLLAIGFIAAMTTFTFIARKQGLKEKTFSFYFYIGLISIVFGVAGGILFQLIFDIFKYTFDIFRLYGIPKSEGGKTLGYTFMGGLLTGTVVFLLLQKFFSRRFLSEEQSKVGFAASVRAFPAALFAALFFARVGCFLAACCYGIKMPDGTPFPLGVDFGKGVDPVTGARIPQWNFPANLCEAVFALIMFFVCFMAQSEKTGKKLKFLDTGRDPIIIAYISYGLFRFVLEYLRGDPERGNFLFQSLFTPSQCLCIAMLIAGVLMLYFRLQKKPEVMRCK
ncbi:MAG: prolipoprotein diacylglyceryl transferase [Firmicutes bacterium]|nr:prolipoprotein diacylglyceryl transferase [Bacillota bacterium]